MPPPTTAAAPTELSRTVLTINGELTSFAPFAARHTTTALLPAAALDALRNISSFHAGDDAHPLVAVAATAVDDGDDESESEFISTVPSAAGAFD